jgi:carboxymethylenebutenolidase
MPALQPMGYLAKPAYGGGPGVLVLHAWWGLNDTVKAFCERLAAEGFVAFAPDLYHGKIATTIPDAESLMSSLNSEQAMAEVAEAAAYLSGLTGPGAAGLGAIGFSLGAYYAVALSVADPERMRAVVVFYGAGEGDFTRSEAGYLGHFAENDEYEEAYWINKLEEGLAAAGRPVTFYTYAGTKHWFCEPDRPDVYDPEAAQLAWERTIPFLRDALS